MSAPVASLTRRTAPGLKVSSMWVRALATVWSVRENTIFSARQISASRESPRAD
jgi:hypothetical protein